MFKQIKIMLVIMVVLLVTGCTTMSKLLGLAGDVNDSALASAEITICRAASIGSVIRRYDTREKAEAWAELCAREDDGARVIVNGEPHVE